MRLRLEYIGRFSIECLETKTKTKTILLQWPITTNVNNTINQSELEANTHIKRRQARENMCDQVAIGFGFTSDWLRRWCKFFKPITKRKAKEQQQRIKELQRKGVAHVIE